MLEFFLKETIFGFMNLGAKLQFFENNDMNFDLNFGITVKELVIKSNKYNDR